MFLWMNSQMTADAACTPFSGCGGRKKYLFMCQCNKAATYGAKIKSTSNLQKTSPSCGVQFLVRRHERGITIKEKSVRFAASFNPQPAAHPVITGAAFRISSPPAALFDSTNLRSASYHSAAVSSTGLYSCLLLLSAAAQSAAGTTTCSHGGGGRWSRSKTCWTPSEARFGDT